MENLKHCAQHLKQLVVVKVGVALVLVSAYKVAVFRICGCNLGFEPVISSGMTDSWGFVLFCFF